MADRARYDGFISYRHSNRQTAIVRPLQSALHRFAKPWWKLRAVRLYRDETNLGAQPDLWGTIATALRSSRFFLLIASPDAAASHWVGREIEEWLGTRGTDGLIIVLTDGDLVWDADRNRYDANRTTALPPTALASLTTEPKYVDLRWIEDVEKHANMSDARFVDAIATIAADLHGSSKDEIAGADVRAFRRTRRVAQAAVAAIVAFAIGTAGFAWNYLRQRDAAVAQRNRAEQALLRSAAKEASLSTKAGRPEEAWNVLVAARKTVAEGRFAAAPPSDFRAAALEALIENRFGPWMTLSVSPASRTIFESDLQAPVMAAFDDSGALVAGAFGHDLGVWSIATGESKLDVTLPHRIEAVSFHRNAGLVIAWGRKNDDDRDDLPVLAATVVDVASRQVRTHDVTYCRYSLPCIARAARPVEALVDARDAPPERLLGDRNALTGGLGLLLVGASGGPTVQGPAAGRYYLETHVETAGDDRRLDVFAFDLQTQTGAKIQPIEDEPYSDAVLARDVGRVVLSHLIEHGTMGVYDLDVANGSLRARRVATLEASHSQGVTNVAITSDGARIAYTNQRTGTGPGIGTRHTAVVDVATTRESWATAKEGPMLLSPSWNVLSQIEDGDVWIRDAATSERLFTLRGDPRAFDRDGTLLLLQEIDRTAPDPNGPPTVLRVRLAEIAHVQSYSRDAGDALSTRSACGGESEFATLAYHPLRRWNPHDWRSRPIPAGEMARASFSNHEKESSLTFSAKWKNDVLAVTAWPGESDPATPAARAAAAAYRTLATGDTELVVSEKASADGRWIGAVVNALTNESDETVTQKVTWMLFARENGGRRLVRSGPVELGGDVPMQESLTGIDFLDEDRAIAVQTADCKLVVYETGSGREIGTITPAFANMVSVLPIAEDLIAVKSWDWYQATGTVQIVDYPSLSVGPTLTFFDADESDPEARDPGGGDAPAPRSPPSSDRVLYPSGIGIEMDIDAPEHAVVVRERDGSGRRIDPPPWGKRLLELIR